MEYRKSVPEESLKPDQIYTDKSELCWKCLPARTLVPEEKSTLPDIRDLKTFFA
jgi:hypothetical protein